MKLTASKNANWKAVCKAVERILVRIPVEARTCFLNGPSPSSFNCVLHGD